MRAAITTLAIAIALAFGVTLAAQESAAPTDTTAQTTDQSPAPEPSAEAPVAEAEPPAAESPAPPTGTAPAATPDPIPGLRVQPPADAPLDLINLGSNDPDGAYAMKVQLTRWGGGIYNIALTHHYEKALEEVPLVIQQADPARAYPFAAQSVIVNGDRIDLETVAWEAPSPGRFTITLIDGDDQPVLRIERLFELRQDPDRGYDLTCFQTFTNLSGDLLQVQFVQNGQGELPADTGYLGDRRAFIAGYYNNEIDPRHVLVYTDDTFLARDTVLDRLNEGNGTSWTLWPSELGGDLELAWVATVNRYFAAAVHQPVQWQVEGAEEMNVAVPPLQRDFPEVRVRALGKAGDGKDQRALITVFTSRTIDLAPNAEAHLNIALFAGPREPELFNQPPYSWMNFSEMIRYELGCAWCTFQFLARWLLGFLTFIHSIIGDWAIAIIILVLVVRGLLHPITKRAQINMTKMGKAMQAMAPEMEKLKAKYKDNPQKLQVETMRLYREKGVNPANMLGCLPMFLQTPLWIALYAMLAFAIELRHEPAFYGVFQAIRPGWAFLADLSSPDRFITFYHEPHMFWMFDISSLNILPLLMGIVFFFNQKLMQPATPPANEQAAQMQKTMKWMTLLFPLVLYSAPSGLTLYILASTCAGIVDSYFVRRHIKREEEAGTLFKKKEPKPGGLADRFRKAIEERARQVQLEQERRQKGGGKGKKRR